MRATSQYFSIRLYTTNTRLFLFLIIAGCTHLGFIEQTTPQPDIDVKRSYFSNGNIEYEAEYLNGKLDGLSRTWYENGPISSASLYDNGQPHGIWKKYHINGSIMYEVHYEYGEKHGIEYWYYDNGQTKSEQRFSYGISVSEMIRWQPDGKIIY